jgi:ring-1,2-phenylacetyl-CoA epoxidase subunit PaaC
LREERYHFLHATTWVSQLGRSTDEARRRMQDALDICYPMAFGLFEPTSFDAAIAAEGIQASEAQLEAQWVEAVSNFLKDCGLSLPAVENKAIHYGGRVGMHTTHLASLLLEMDEVFAIDETAVW